MKILQLNNIRLIALLAYATVVFVFLLKFIQYNIYSTSRVALISMFHGSTLHPIYCHRSARVGLYCRGFGNGCRKFVPPSKLDGAYVLTSMLSCDMVTELEVAKIFHVRPAAN